MGGNGQAKLFTPEFWADPFPFFARLRAEEPVHRAILPPRTPIWLVTRYEDVQGLLKDGRFAKDKSIAMTPEQLRKMPWVPPMFRPLERNMLDRDPPDHTRLRALVHKAFTPRLVEQMRGRVQTLADELLDAAERRGGMDLIRDYALPLPMTLITEILGVPSRDREKFHRWSKVIVSVNAFNVTWRVFPAVWQFTRYLRRFFAARRADPRDDLTSTLIQAEEAGDRMSGDELLAMVFLLLIAGHETTVNLIGSGVLELLRHPDQMDRLRRDPSLCGPPSRSCCGTPRRSSSPPSGTPARTWSWGAWRSRAGGWSSARSARRTGTGRRSRTPTGWTSRGRRTSTWGSARASTTAWGRRWPAWRRGSPSRRSCVGCPTSASRPAGVAPLATELDPARAGVPAGAL